MRTVIIKLGGSLVVPDETDRKFLDEFKGVIEEYVSKGFRFGIVVGGGMLARRNQEAARRDGEIDQKALDMVGIEATKQNAMIVRDMFGDMAAENIITDYSVKIETPRPVLIGAGYKPDWSTDFDTIMLAEEYGEKEVVILSNIDYVYDKDPKRFSDAKPLKEITWGKMRELCKGPWKPGLNAPLDPKAAELGALNKHKVVFLRGLDNLRNYLDEKEFRGSVVKD